MTFGEVDGGLKDVFRMFDFGCRFGQAHLNCVLGGGMPHERRAPGIPPPNTFLLLNQTACRGIWYNIYHKYKGMNVENARQQEDVPHMRKIDTITIRGFKSILELVDFPLHDLNIIVGANGAGKSNFIQIFRLVRNMLLKNLQGYTVQHGGASSFLFNGPKTTDCIQTEFRFGDNSYRFALVPTADDKFALSEERRYRNSSWYGFSYSLPESRLYDDKDEQSGLFQGYHGPGYYVYRSISQWMIYHFHDTSDFAPMLGYEIVEDSEYLRENASNIAPFLLRLRDGSSEERRSYSRIIDAVRLVMPFFDDFRLSPETFGQARKVKLSWKQKGADYPFQPYQLSDGSIRFICLATALLQPDPPSTIVIDEPELGLHPQAISVLAELISLASRRTQVIVATQSPLLLDHFSVEDIVVASRQAGATTLERLKKEDFSVWLDEFSTGELWMRNVIAGGIVHE